MAREEVSRINEKKKANEEKKIEELKRKGILDSDDF